MQRLPKAHETEYSELLQRERASLLGALRGSMCLNWNAPCCRSVRVSHLSLSYSWWCCRYGREHVQVVAMGKDAVDYQTELVCMVPMHDTSAADAARSATHLLSDTVGPSIGNRGKGSDGAEGPFWNFGGGSVHVVQSTVSRTQYDLVLTSRQALVR